MSARHCHGPSLGDGPGDHRSCNLPPAATSWHCAQLSCEAVSELASEPAPVSDSVPASIAGAGASCAAADLARAAILLSLPVVYWLGWLSLWHLFAVAIFAGTAHVVFNTAYAAFFVRLVPNDKFLEANSKLSATRSFSFMGGPAVGGLLNQWLTAPFALVVDALSFVFSAIQISRLKVTSATVAPKPTAAP